MREVWRRLCSARFKMQSEMGKVALQSLLVEVFRHHVGRVILSCDLKQLKIFGSDLVLYPKISHGQV